MTGTVLGQQAENYAAISEYWQSGTTAIRSNRVQANDQS